MDAVTISKKDLEKLSGDFYNALKNAFMGTLENVEIFDRKGNSTEFFITFRSKSRFRSRGLVRFSGRLCCSENKIAARGFETRNQKRELETFSSSHGEEEGGRICQKDQV